MVVVVDVVVVVVVVRWKDVIRTHINENHLNSSDSDREVIGTRW